MAVGIGLEISGILASLPGAKWTGFLNNGLTAGTLVALLLTWFVEVTDSRPQRVEVPFAYSSLPEVTSFLQIVAERRGWNTEAVTRLCAAGEETLLSLLDLREDDEFLEPEKLTVVARSRAAKMELEFFASIEGQNLQDQLALLGDDSLKENEACFRLLRHYAESVRHQEFHGVNVVKVTVANIGSDPY